MGRAPCCDKANVKKGPWSPEEDAKLKAYIEKNGTGGNWIALPQKIGLKRCGKSCRLRWLNYLRPNLKHGSFSEAEENVICSLYISIGSRWSIIAAQLPGRTDNDIKNYWNTRLKKKLLGKQRKEQVLRRTTLDHELQLKTEHQRFLSTLTGLNYQAPYVWSESPSMLPQLATEDGNEIINPKSPRSGGRFPDERKLFIEVPNMPATGGYSIPVASAAHHVQRIASSSSSVSMNSMESLQSHLQSDNYDVTVEPNVFHKLEDFGEELNVLSAHYQSQEAHHYEDFYGMEASNMISSGSSGSSSAGSSSWENSLAYSQLVSEYETCLQSIRQNSPFEESTFSLFPNRN